MINLADLLPSPESREQGEQIPPAAIRRATEISSALVRLHSSERVQGLMSELAATAEITDDQLEQQQSVEVLAAEKVDSPMIDLNPNLTTADVANLSEYVRRLAEDNVPPDSSVNKHQPPTRGLYDQEAA